MSSSSARLLLAGALIVATAGTAAAWRGPRCIGAGRDAVPAPFVLEAARARRIRPSAPPGARRRMSGRSSWAPPNPVTGASSSAGAPTLSVAPFCPSPRWWRPSSSPATDAGERTTARSPGWTTPRPSGRAQDSRRRAGAPAPT